MLDDQDIVGDSTPYQAGTLIPRRAPESKRPRFGKAADKTCEHYFVAIGRASHDGQPPRFERTPDAAATPCVEQRGEADEEEDDHDEKGDTARPALGC